MLKRHIKAIGHARERLSEPLLTMLTIVMAALMFIIMPIHAAGLLKTQTVGFGVLIIFITGVVMLSGSLSAALAMGAALALGFASWILRQSGPSTIDVYLDATAYIIVAFALALIVCRAVFGPGPVTYHRVIGAVLLYLTIAMIFVALYAFVGLFFPDDAFKGMSIRDAPNLTANLIYFSFVTLTSTGYGDVVPVHPIARSLANLEAIIGQLYPATLLARLVTLELEGRATRRRENGGK
jgi:Ion channel